MRLRRVGIAVALGSRGASESRFGTLDAGSENDLARAFGMACDRFGDRCCGGLSMYVDHRTSESQDEHAEIATTAAREGLYRTAREATCRNEDFLRSLLMPVGMCFENATVQTRARNPGSSRRPRGRARGPSSSAPPRC